MEENRRLGVCTGLLCCDGVCAAASIMRVGTDKLARMIMRRACDGVRKLDFPGQISGAGARELGRARRDGNPAPPSW